MKTMARKKVNTQSALGFNLVSLCCLLCRAAINNEIELLRHSSIGLS